MYRQELFAASALITGLSGIIFFVCGSADNIDHRIDRRPLTNRHVVVSSTTGVLSGYSDIRTPAAALGTPSPRAIPAVNGVIGGGRARVALNHSVEVGGLGSLGYERLGAAS